MEIKKYKSLFRRYGVAGVTELVCYKILRIFGIRVKRQYILKYNIENNHVSSLTGVQELKISDFQRYCKGDEDWFNKSKLKRIEAALDKNIALGIIKDDRIINYGCINPCLTRIFDILIKEKACFFFDDYTHPDYRGQGFHKKSLIDRINYVSKLDYQEAYIIVDRYNKASYKGVVKSGFHIYKTICLYKIWRGKTRSLY